MTISKIILSVLPQLKLANGHKRAMAASIIEESATSPRDEGRECLPKKKRRKLHLLSSKLLGHEAENDKNRPDVGILSRRKHRPSSLSKLSIGDTTSDHGPDVGILGKCPANQVCLDDATSFLGGRCIDNTVASARRLEDKEVCYFTCPDPKVCECIYAETFPTGIPECVTSIASSCRNGEYAQCIPDHIGNSTVMWKTLFCSYYECMDDGQKDFRNCLADAYVKSFRFCEEYDTALNDSSDCSDILYVIQNYGEYYFQNVLRDPNKFAKKQQLIDQTFDECVSNISLTGTDQYPYYDDGGLEEYYARYYDLYGECQCKRQSEHCELYSSLGFHQWGRSQCIVANCCNNSIPDVNLTACYELATAASVDAGSLPFDAQRPILSASPSISPSVEPSGTKESNKNNSLPDQSGHKQNNSAHTYPTKSPLGLDWAALLFASTMGFLLFEQLMA